MTRPGFRGIVHHATHRAEQATGRNSPIFVVRRLSGLSKLNGSMESSSLLFRRISICTRILGLLCLALQVLAQTPQQDEWATLSTRAEAAYQRGAYAESQRLYASALVLAEQFGPHDERLAATLSNVATSDRALGRYAEAEKLYFAPLTSCEPHPAPSRAKWPRY